MKKLFTFLLIGTLLVVLTACSSKKTDFEKTIVTTTRSFVHFNKEQLVNNATAIIAGKVVVGSEVKNVFEGLPATDYKIKVNKVFKGNPSAEILVRTAGGENEKFKHVVPDEITFQPGEKVVLFLNDDKGDRTDKNDFDYWVVGNQGKFKEENGKFKNKEFTFDVANFEKEIKQIEEQNKVKGLKPFKAEDKNDI